MMSNEKRSSFVFYESWLEAIKNLPRDIQGDVLTAIIEYGLYGETTDNLKPITKAMLEIIKPQIDSNRKRFENGKKGAEYGHLGGRPKKNNPKETPTKPLNNPKETPIMLYDNVSDKSDIDKTSTNVDAKEEENKDSPTEAKNPPKSKRRTPLTSSRDKPLVYPFTSEAFMAAWNDLCATPKWKKKINHALQLSLDKLGKYDEEFAIKQIYRAIESGWAGVVFDSTPREYEQWKRDKNGICVKSTTDIGLVLKDNSPDKYNSPQERKWEARWKK